MAPVQCGAEAQVFMMRPFRHLLDAIRSAVAWPDEGMQVLDINKNLPTRALSPQRAGWRIEPRIDPPVPTIRKYRIVASDVLRRSGTVKRTFTVQPERSREIRRTCDLCNSDGEQK